MTTLFSVNRRYRSDLGGSVVVRKPRDVREIQELVRGTDGRVKVLGGRYSVGSLTLPDGASSGSENNDLVLDLSDMNRVGTPDENGLVTVEAGATMRQLLDGLRGTGFQPGVVPLFGNFSIGAISSTPMYDLSVATGGRHAKFSADAVEYRLVLADGSLKTVSKDEDDLTYFLRTHQGMLGIVYQVTLRVYPERLHRVRFVSENISSLEDLYSTIDCSSEGNKRAHEYLYIYPGCGQFCKEQHSRTGWKEDESTSAKVEDEHRGGRGSSSRSGLPMKLYQTFYLFWDKLCYYLVPNVVVPRFQLGLQQLYVRLTNWFGDLELSPFDRGVLASPERRIALCDWHFSPGDFPRAIKTVIDVCERSKKERGVTASFISVYYIPKNDTGAGYTTKREAKYAIDMVSYFPEDAKQVELEEEWGRVARSLGGIPAINKNSDFGFGPSDVKKIYGDKDYARFRSLCIKYDPTGRFRNKRLAELFALHKESN